MIFLLIFAIVSTLIGFFFLWRRYPVKSILRSKSHLESVFDSVPIPIAVVTKDYKLIRVNKTYVSDLGKNFSDVLDSPCYNFFKQEQKPCEFCILKEVFEKKKSMVKKSVLLKTDNKEKYYDIQFFPIFNFDSTQVESVVEYLVDVTDEVIAREQLKQAKHKIETAYETLNEEMYLAREIQLSILPTSFPQLEGAVIAANYNPVDSVGGDLYDFIDLGEYRYGVFIGDVSGHGLPAAFIGAMAKMSFFTHSKTNLSPKEVMKKVNDDLCKNISTGHYLTGFYGILNLNDNSFTYTRASHPYPLLIHADGTTEDLDTNGLFIGMVKDTEYEEKKVMLSQGDKIFLFTDGLYEHYDKNVDMLGQNRFNEILKESSDLPTQDIPRNVFDKVHSYYGKTNLSDDRSLVVISVTEKSREERFRLLCNFNPDEEIVVATFYTFKDSEQYLSMILREMDKLGYPDKSIRRMKVSITELFSNAIEHGNKNDPTKKVDIAFVVNDTMTKVACVDEGDGFKISDVPDPTLDENIAKDRGRGLFIMNNFVDKLLQNEKGNRVTIIKYKMLPE